MQIQMNEFLFAMILTELEDAVGKENCSTRAIDKVMYGGDLNQAGDTGLDHEGQHVNTADKDRIEQSHTQQRIQEALAGSNAHTLEVMHAKCDHRNVREHDGEQLQTNVEVVLEVEALYKGVNQACYQNRRKGLLILELLTKQLILGLFAVLCYEQKARKSHQNSDDEMVWLIATLKSLQKPKRKLLRLITE